MRNAALAAAVLAWFPLAAVAQGAPPPAQPSQWVDVPPQPPPASPPPQVAPPPQYAAPAPPPPQYAPPPAYAPPPQYAAPAAAPLPPPLRPMQQRGGWYIGFGLGGGDGSVKDAVGTSSFKDYLGKSPTTVSLNFKVGATLTPRWLLGLDISGVSSEAEESGATATVSIVNYDAMATFFPWERGFFLRGGLGLSKFTLDVNTPGFSGTGSKSGTNAAFGVGYAWWLGQTFNLTVNLDFSGQSYGGDSTDGSPKSSSFWALGVGFDWY